MEENNTTQNETPRRPWINLNISEDHFGAVCIILAIGFAASLLATAVGVPLAYYHTSVTTMAMEKGYEQERVRGDTIWVKKDAKK